MPPLSVLIKPASGMCNLDCTYCFYHDITNKREQKNYGFMSIDTLEQVIIRVFEFAQEQCTFAFQGGEPTLIGLPFYEKLIELVNIHNTKNIKIFYALQTNGYRLQAEWGDFFFKHHFLIGVSLDGTIHTHNYYRKDAYGKDTFKEIMDTIHIFNDKQVEYNILTVVNSKTASGIKKIYAYYKKNKFQYLQFIPCLDPFEEGSGKEVYSLTPELYGQFLCELFDLWYSDIMEGKMVSIRLFENYISILKGGVAESCDMRGICSLQHVIEADGSVYPCDFYVFEKYKLGDVTSNSISEMQEQRNKLKFVEESIVYTTTCKNCQYYSLCRGGCKRYRMMSDYSDLQNNYFCASYKTFFDYALNRLIQISRIFR